MVKEKKCDILEEIYKDRLFWNNRTGLFTLRGLQRSDSGVYGFDSKKGAVFLTSHRLTVYEPVAAPAVKTVHRSAESCTLLCLVKTAEETTLLWYKDEDILNQSSSALSLPLTVHRQDLNSSYRCVAANPAEEKTLHVNVTTSCTESNNTKSGNTTDRHYKIIVPIVLAAVVLLVALFIRWWFFLKNKKTTTETQAGSEDRASDVVYTEVQLCEDRRSQGRNVPASSGPDEPCHLSTLYSKLELRNMSQSC
uniref:uncharacterized protein n=1 Tax=Semicossyphus pulcher TaxID=241346 RepID=UPI0037E8F90B